MMMTPVLSLKQHRNFSTGRHILQIWNKTHYYKCDLVFQWSGIWYIDVIDLYVHISTFIWQKMSIASTKLSVLNAKFQLQHQISMKVNLEWRRCFTNVWLCVNRGGLACLLLSLQKTGTNIFIKSFDENASNQRCAIWHIWQENLRRNRTWTNILKSGKPWEKQTFYAFLCMFNWFNPVLEIFMCVL